MKHQNDEIDQLILQNIQALSNQLKDYQQRLVSIQSRIEVLEKTLGNLRDLPTQDQLREWETSLNSLTQQLKICVGATSEEAKRLSNL